MKAVKQQAKNGVAQAIASVYTQLQDMLGKLLRDVEQKVGLAFKQYVRQHGNDLQRRQKELADRGNMNAAEVAKKRREVAELDNALQSIMRVLQPWMQDSSCI